METQNLSNDLVDKVYIGLAYVFSQNRYDIFVSDSWYPTEPISSMDHSSVLYILEEDEISDFVERLNNYIIQNCEPPSGNTKMSEYKSLWGIHLVRYNQNSFVVFNRYWRNISGIPELEMEFKKIEGN